MCYKCEHWHSRQTFDGMLQDIYDGRVWKKFQFVDNSSFLAAPLNYGFALKIYWFQPYFHIIASVGVIYLTVLNLPRYIYIINTKI